MAFLDVSPDSSLKRRREPDQYKCQSAVAKAEKESPKQEREVGSLQEQRYLTDVPSWAAFSYRQQPTVTSKQGTANKMSPGIPISLEKSGCTNCGPEANSHDHRASSRPRPPHLGTGQAQLRRWDAWQSLSNCVVTGKGSQQPDTITNFRFISLRPNILCPRRSSSAFIFFGGAQGSEQGPVCPNPSPETVVHGLLHSVLSGHPSVPS